MANVLYYAQPKTLKIGGSTTIIGVLSFEMDPGAAEPMANYSDNLLMPRYGGISRYGNTAGRFTINENTIAASKITPYVGQTDATGLEATLAKAGQLRKT